MKKGLLGVAGIAVALVAAFFFMQLRDAGPHIDIVYDPNELLRILKITSLEKVDLQIERVVVNMKYGDP